MLSHFKKFRSADGVINALGYELGKTSNYGQSGMGT
jgi:hypothetical protein